MADIKEALKTAGVKAATVEPFDLHGQQNCFVITIENESPTESWQKLRAVTEKTGYYPVFPLKEEINSWNFEAESWAMKTFIPLPEPGPASVSQEPNYAAIADANERRNAIRQDMLKEYDMTDATPEQLNKPLTRDQLQAATRRQRDPQVLSALGNLFNLTSYEELVNAEKQQGPAWPSLNEMIAQEIERVEQMVQMLADRPKKNADWNALKEFEAESLSRFGTVEEPPSFKQLIASGETLDIEKWFDLIKEVEGDAAIGDFTRDKIPSYRAPTSKKLMLLPVKKPWHIPAILRLGNWNANPPAFVHVAMLKRWHERFGAEVVTIGRDTMYLKVKEPVSTKNAALELASEQYAYCPDNVLQGGDGTLSGLAIDLLDSKVWAFWWD